MRPVTFSPDGRLLVTGCHDGLIRLWDVRSGALIKALSGHRSSVTALSFSPNGELFASAALDGSVKIWDFGTGAATFTLENGSSVWAVASSADNSTVASGDGNGVVVLWDLKKTPTPVERDFWQVMPKGVSSMSYSRDGRFLAAGSGGASVRVFDLRTSGEYRDYAVSSGDDSVWCVAFAGDGKTLAAASGTVNGSGKLTVWNLSDPEAPVASIRQAANVLALSFSPNNKLLALGEGDCNVHILNTGVFDERFSLRCHAHAVSSVAFSPDGKLLASGSGDGTAIIWDMQKIEMSDAK